MCINCIVFMVLCVFHSESFIIDDKRSQVNIITSNIISQFAEHDVIFHYDNETKSRVYPIIARAVTNASYFMINYDSHSDMILRPQGYKFIHVVLLRNCTNFTKYLSANQFPLEYADIIYFVFNLVPDKEATENQTKEFTLWKKNSLDEAGGHFVLYSTNLTLYTICFYCGERSKKLRKISDLYENEKDGEIYVPKLDKYINKFTDFKEHVFHVGYTNFKPFFWCNILGENDTIINYEIYGSEGELLCLFNSKYNARFVMTDYSNYSNAWVQIIKSVKNHTLDWAVGGITLTFQRSEVVDFTSFIQNEPYTVLYSVYADPWMSWKNIIIPFELAIWLALILAIFLISVLLYMSTKLSEYSSNLSFWYFVQGSLHYLVEQPLPRIPKEMRTRWTTLILMSLWLCVALVMTNAYKSKLTSSLISANEDEPDSIDELVEQDYYFEVGDSDTSVLEENLGSSCDPKFLETLRRSSADTDFCTSVRNSIGHKLGVIEEETFMQYTIQEQCRNSMSMEELQDLRIIKDELFPSQHAWPMQLSAPYRQTFNVIISRLHAGGIFNKWNKDYYSAVTKVPKSDHFHSSGKPNRPSNSLALILGPGFIWMLGMLAATLVFIAELIHRR